MWWNRSLFRNQWIETGCFEFCVDDVFVFLFVELCASFFVDGVPSAHSGEGMAESESVPQWPSLIDSRFTLMSFGSSQAPSDSCEILRLVLVVDFTLVFFTLFIFFNLVFLTFLTTFLLLLMLLLVSAS